MDNMKLPVLVFASMALCQLHAADEPLVDFVRQIKPILASRCVECHHSGALFGDLNLQNRALAMRKRKLGPVIVPGQPDKSPLYLTLTLPPANPKAMPATGHRIPKDEVALIRLWILEGAKWPAGEEGAIHPPSKKGGDV